MKQPGFAPQALALGAALAFSASAHAIDSALNSLVTDIGGFVGYCRYGGGNCGTDFWWRDRYYNGCHWRVWNGEVDEVALNGVKSLVLSATLSPMHFE
ncbi:hypothetical protein [Paraburkholderia sp. SIMBA_030]|uniref:hypothetical protein n=1 Tax=Paraburkholderia sp. SIMBA_030 TaxID=3085773 RepID=UPI003979AF95